VSKEGFYYVIFPLSRDKVEKLMKEALKGWIPDKAIPLVVDEVLRRAFFHEGIIVSWGGGEEERALLIWSETAENMRRENLPDWRETRLIKVIKVAKLEEEEEE